MESWDVLPQASLERGPESDGFARLGCETFRDVGRALHELPYGRNSDRADYRRVLPEGRGTCSTKHALLAAVAAEQGLAVSLAMGIYDMTDANTPGVGPVLAAHGLDAVPEAHCYVRYAGHRVDVTRSGPEPREPIARLHREWSIEPAQIGAHKLALHRRYLRGWLAERPHLGLSLDELWRIREACILALGPSA